MTNIKSKILTTTKDLIRIPSVTSDLNQLNKIIAYVAQRAKKEKLQYKIHINNDMPSIIVGNLTNPKIILNGHLDVVPAPKSMFKPVVKNGRLYGRGAVDMKGSFATLLELLIELKDLPIALHGVCDEEVGGFNGTKKLVSLHHPKVIVFGEPTNMKIQEMSKGVLMVRIRTTGQPAHSATLWEGDNAIRKLAEELIDIDAAFKQPASDKWVTTVNIGKITGGSTPNQVAESAEAILDIRRIPSQTSASILKKISTTLKYADSHLEVIMDEAHHQLNPQDKYVRKLAAILKDKSPFVSIHFASDARHYFDSKTTSLVFGPTGQGLHTNDESIEIASLIDYYQVLKRFIMEVQNGD